MGELIFHATTPRKGDYVFVDTKILLYAYYRDAGGKHAKARECVKSLWDRPYPPAISVQVLQEFFVNLTRLSTSIHNAKRAVEDLFAWEVVENDAAVLLDGIAILERWKLSFRDSLIVAAAKKAEATCIWSEDLQTDGQIVGIAIINPLKG